MYLSGNECLPRLSFVLFFFAVLLNGATQWAIMSFAFSFGKGSRKWQSNVWRLQFYVFFFFFQYILREWWADADTGVLGRILALFFFFCVCCTKERSGPIFSSRFFWFSSFPSSTRAVFSCRYRWSRYIYTYIEGGPAIVIQIHIFLYIWAFTFFFFYIQTAKCMSVNGIDANSCVLMHETGVLVSVTSRRKDTPILFLFCSLPFENKGKE